MTFDKIVYRESEQSEPGICLTVDFAIGEIAVHPSGGEVMWRRLAGPSMAVLRMKIDACHFEAWDSGCVTPDGHSPEWTLELCRGEKSVKRVTGGGAVPDHRPAFASLVDLCFSLAETRSKSRCVPVPPDWRAAACFRCAKNAVPGLKKASIMV